MRTLYAFLLLSLTIIYASSPVKLETKHSLGYTNEIFNTVVRVEDDQIRTIKSVSLIDLNANRNIVTKDEFVNKEKIEFSFSFLNKNKYEIYAEIEYSNGDLEQSNIVSFKIDSLPEERIEKKIIVRNLSPKTYKGYPTSILVEVFGDQEIDDTLLTTIGFKIDNITRVKTDINRTIKIENDIIPIKMLPLKYVFEESGDTSFSERGIISDTFSILNEKPDSFTVGNYLELTSIFFPKEPILEQEIQFFYIECSSDGFFTENTLEKYFKWPKNWKEEISNKKVIWNGSTIEEQLIFVYVGTFSSNFGFNFKSISIPYKTFDNKIKNSDLELGRVSKFKALDFIIPVTIILLLLLLTSIVLFYPKRRIKKRNPIVETPLKEISENKIAGFSESYELTKREKEILEILVHGKSTKEISEDLYISPETTKKHIKNIMKKTSVNSRLEILVKVSNFENK